jgi:aminoglycoside phosphotransferase (APT) family kinase protein
VDGTSIESALAKSAEPTAAAMEISLSLVDSAAALGRVDYEAVGLSDLGRAGGWAERQVARWRRQLDSYLHLDGYAGFGDLDAVATVAAWLDDRRPSSSRPGLMHGDLHFGNVLIATSRPRVAAVVDWELATVGDPLLDLAHLLVTWPDGRNEPIAETIPHLPPRETLIERYAGQSPRSLDELTWYLVLACYRLGIILEGTKARADAGLAPRATGDRLHGIAAALFRQASELISHSR